MGWSILLMFVLGVIAETTRTTLINWTDSQATWNSIIHARFAYALAIVAFIVIIILDTFLAIGLFAILRFRQFVVVSLMAALRLIYVAIKGVSLIGLLLAADVYFRNHYGKDLASQALAYLKFHETGFGIGLIIFGAHLLLLAYIARREQFPKLIWWMLILAGLGYAVNSLSSLFIHKDHIQIAIISIFIVPMTFSEVAFFLWLWLKGVPVQPSDTSGQSSPNAA
jgi:hypothetical protein